MAKSVDKTTTLRATIVVRSYNRITALCQLLERLLTQDYRRFDICVVEQSTRVTDEEAHRLKTLAARDRRVRIFKRPPLGGSAARNEGCRLARGDVIVLFDDDDLPASDTWLTRLMRNFDDPKCLAVAGRHIVEGGPQPPYANMARARRRVLRYSPLKWQHCYVRSDVRSDKIENLMGGNTAIRRSVLSRAGLWDTCVKVEDENSFCYRLQRVMGKDEYLVFDPEAAMIRRLNIAGGLGKRQLSAFAYGWRIFEFFHNIVGHYHRARFIALYPAYFVFAFIVTVDWTWNESAAHRGRTGYKVATVAALALLSPLLWTGWLGRLTIERIVHGAPPRETEFRPYHANPDDLNRGWPIQLNNKAAAGPRHAAAAQ